MICVFEQRKSASKKRGSTHKNSSVKKRKQILEEDSDDDVEMIDRKLPASRGIRASPRRKASIKSVKDDVMDVDDEVEKEATQKVDDEEYANEKKEKRMGLVNNKERGQNYTTSKDILRTRDKKQNAADDNKVIELNVTLTLPHKLPNRF